MLLLVFLLEQESLHEDLMNVNKYLGRGGEIRQCRLFSVLFSDRTRGKGHKLKYRNSI